MRETIDYWRRDYRWRDEEARMNRLPQYRSSIDIEGYGDLNVHFVHSPSNSDKAIPLLFIHGWPGSFLEVSKALPALNAAGFHLVAPSLPGYGFSSLPPQPGFKMFHIAELLHKLMIRLGYTTYVVQGGDWGAMIASTMAASYHPSHIKALHVNLFDAEKPDFETEPTYTAFEQQSLAQHKDFNENGFTYCMVQSSKPRTLGFAMHDSPIGMLAWTADKLHTWSDAYPWSQTELITWTLLHYLPGPTTAFQIYRENSATEMVSGARAGEYLRVPTGVSAFAKEAEMVPRCWAERRANVVFWREHGRGGHFAAYEKPEELVGDLVEFFGAVWEG